MKWTEPFLMQRLTLNKRGSPFHKKTWEMLFINCLLHDIFHSADKIFSVRSRKLMKKLRTPDQTQKQVHHSENQVHSGTNKQNKQKTVWSTLDLRKSLKSEGKMKQFFLTCIFQGSSQNTTKLTPVFWSPLCLFSLQWQCDLRGLIWGNKLSKAGRSAQAACRREKETLQFVWCYSEQSHWHCNQSCVWFYCVCV